MEPTSDVRAGDDVEHGRIVAHAPGAEAFAKVAVEIDTHDWLLIRSAPSGFGVMCIYCRTREIGGEKALARQRIRRDCFQGLRQALHRCGEIPCRILRGLDTDGREADAPSCRGLDEAPQIGPDDNRDLRITTSRSPIGEKHQRLAAAGNLNGAESDAVGNNVGPARMRQRRAIQPISHAIGFAGDPPFGFEKARDRRRIEIIILWT